MAFDNLKGKMGVALYALCMSITFMFLVTSAPISQFKGKGINSGGASKISCVTVWGLKNDCGANEYDYRPTVFGCDKPKQLFQAAEAFYIIGVIVSLLCCILCAVFFAGVQMKVALVALGSLSVVFTLIPWAIMTAVWYQSYCDNVGVSVSNISGATTNIPTGQMLRDSFHTSAGYGLTIAAWCVNVVGLTLLLTVSS